MQVKRNRQKKFVFYQSEDTYAKFRTKLVYENMKQAAFFREIILSFLEDDKHLRAWIDENPRCKVKKRTKKVRARENKRIAQEEKDFNFNGINVDEIFDIIADEDKDD